MENFTMIVSICSGLMVIIGLIGALCKPIRERITKVKEREQREKKMIDEVKEEIHSVKDEVVEVKDDIKDVRDELDSVRADSREDKAERARTQILRFADEIYQNQKHSKEHFDEILDCITFYNDYCADHPEFKNNRTVQAQKRINEVYAKCLKEHTFLM